MDIFNTLDDVKQKLTDKEYLDLMNQASDLVKKSQVPQLPLECPPNVVNNMFILLKTTYKITGDQDLPCNFHIVTCSLNFKSILSEFKSDRFIERESMIQEGLQGHYIIVYSIYHKYVHSALILSRNPLTMYTIVLPRSLIPILDTIDVDDVDDAILNYHSERYTPSMNMIKSFKMELKNGEFSYTNDTISEEEFIRYS